MKRAENTMSCSFSKVDAEDQNVRRTLVGGPAGCVGGRVSATEGAIFADSPNGSVERTAGRERRSVRPELGLGERFRPREGLEGRFTRL